MYKRRRSKCKLFLRVIKWTYVKHYQCYHSSNWEHSVFSDFHLGWLQVPFDSMIQNDSDFVLIMGKPHAKYSPVHLPDCKEHQAPVFPRRGNNAEISTHPHWRMCPTIWEQYAITKKVVMTVFNSLWGLSFCMFVYYFCTWQFLRKWRGTVK